VQVDQVAEVQVAEAQMAQLALLTPAAVVVAQILE
jgi:hypothetical protein